MDHGCESKVVGDGGRTRHCVRYCCVYMYGEMLPTVIVSEMYASFLPTSFPPPPHTFTAGERVLPTMASTTMSTQRPTKPRGKCQKNSCLQTIEVRLDTACRRPSPTQSQRLFLFIAYADVVSCCSLLFSACSTLGQVKLASGCGFLTRWKPSLRCGKSVKVVVAK